jgi:sugar/nucleoside kinase (ribokinase family)
MSKRILVAVVGAGIGSLAGLLVSFLSGGWNPALVIGALAGAVIPLLVLGQPGR